MADESRVAAGKRFSRDMRLIREDRDTSLESIHTETRIARSLIESFEEGGLYDHPTFNEVYLRSFVRAYAETIDISPKAALEGLDSALDGDYENALAERYLGTASAETVPDAEEQSGSSSASSAVPAPEDDERESPSAPVAGGPEGRGGIVGPPRAVGAEEDETDDSTAPVSEETEASAPASDPSEEAAEPEDTPVEEPDATEELDEPGETLPSSDEEPVDQDSASDQSDSEDETRSDQDGEEADDPGEEDGEAGDEEEDSIEEDEVKEDETESASSASDDRPDWLDEEPDDEAGASAQAQPDPAAAPAEHAEEEPADLGGTGIVGEPTALGEDSKEPAAEAPPAAAGSAPRSSRDGGWRQFFTGARREMVWAGVGVVVILLVLAGLTVAYFSAQGPGPEPSATAAAPDTTATSTPDTTRAPERPPPADVRLGDTLYLTVLATADVGGIRIRRDDDLRRPYWIEDGDISVFPFREELTIESELSNVRLFLEGYPYPFSASDTTAEVVITRSRAAAFVDTLRGAPASFTAQPDTIPVGAPAQQ